MERASPSNAIIDPPPSVFLYRDWDFKGNEREITESDSDITSIFPPNQNDGLSSFIVKVGIWAFFSGINYKLEQFDLDGDTEFEAGEYKFQPHNDKAKSVKLIPHPPKIVVYDNWGWTKAPMELNDSHPNMKRFYGRKRGISSFQVFGGKWTFYTGKKYRGDKCEVQGITEFGPGKYEFSGDARRFNDETLSVKLIVSPLP